MFQLMGYDPVQFTDEKTGEVISGVRVHLLADKETSTVKVGRDVMAVFFKNDRIAGELRENAKCELKFSVRNGKPVLVGLEIKS